MLSLTVEPSSSLAGPSRLESLVDALRGERRLLLDLLRVLERQRAAVAADDLAGLDDSVFAAQRVLRTLAEARRRRRTLLTLVVGDESVALDALDEVLGRNMTDALRTARGELQATARELAGELDRNRRVLQGAISAGDRLIRVLCGAPATPTVYGVRGPESGDARLFIDRQI